MKKLSDLIKENRSKLGISQRELAKRINVNDSYIAKIESDITKKPSVPVLVDLSKELKINVFELLEKAGYSRNEIDNIFNISSNQYSYLSELGNIDKKILNECVFHYDEFERDFLDIVKILKLYKEGEIDTHDAVELINACEKFYLNNDIIVYPSQSGDIEIDYFS
jgi:transcriptional regulator with XRE-family HTH domain